MKNADGKCKDLILEAMAYHLMSSEHKAKKAMNVRFVIFLIKKNCHQEIYKISIIIFKLFSKSIRTRPRIPMGLPKTLIIVGGQAPKAIKKVEAYDYKNECWEKFWLKLFLYKYTHMRHSTFYFDHLKVMRND